MSDRSVSYTIDLEIPESYVGNLLDFIYKKYLLPQTQRFVNIARTTIDGYPTLSFTTLDELGKHSLKATIIGSKPIKIDIKPLSIAVSEEAVTQVRQDILIAVELFEEKTRESTLFFAWREGEEIVPEEVSGKEKKSINSLLLETQVFLFIIFIAFGLFLFPIVGLYAPIVLMAAQFVIVFYSYKFIARAADWQITEDNPTIHLLEYNLPLQEHDLFREKYPRKKIAEIKKKVYEQTIAKKGEIDCNVAGQIFGEFGLACNPENLSTKKVNVYELVRKVAQKFGFPMPKIVVSNTMIPNAAASGPSPSRGIVLITTGLLVQLEEDEIISILGHEFGHLKGHDPLLLYGLMGSEFLFRFYVLLPFFPIIFSSLLLFLAYFWVAMTILYFIAKFFEARADLTSAIVIGQPQILAEALEEIGFKRLLFERVPLYRVQEWVSFDPHPPIYFRIDRLRRFESGTRIKYPLMRSAKDVLRGFLHSL